MGFGALRSRRNQSLLTAVVEAASESGLRRRSRVQFWDRQMANRPVKRHTMSLIVREMQMQTTVRYHFTPVGITINNNSIVDLKNPQH